MSKLKKYLLPGVIILCLILGMLSGCAPAATTDSQQESSPSLGEIFDPSGNPLAHRFSDEKDIRTATFVVAASNSEHRYDVDFRCSGANDHIPIQAALDRLPATGGYIFLLDGTYTFGAQVARAIDNVKFIGCGAATIINWNGVNPVITAGVQSNWLFTQFATDAGGVDIAGAAQSAIRSVWIAGVRIDDPAAAAGGDAVITVAANDTPAAQKARADFVCSGANDDATIEALVAAGGTVKLMVGTYVFGAALDILVSNFVLEGSGPGTVIQGAIGVSYIIVGDGSTALSHVQIANLKIDGTDQTTGYGVYFLGGAGTLVDDCVVRDCIITGCYDAGIYMDFNTVGHGHKILNNHIENCDCGIDSPAICNGHNTLIEGNAILSNVTYGVCPTSGSSIIGNHLYNNGDYDIFVNHSNCLISGNIFFDTRGAGVYCSSSDVYIFGNRFTDCETYGVHAYKVDRITITGNIFSLIDLDGIRLEGGMFHTVTGNNVRGSGNNGIHLTAHGVSAALLSQVVGNNLSGNGTAAGTWCEICIGFLSTTYCTNNIIANNNVRANITEYGIAELAAGCDYNIITGNSVRDASTADISLMGPHTQAYLNLPETTHYFDQRISIMKNTSGGALADGDVVIFKVNVAAGNEVTTTAVLGDDYVWGMAMKAIADNATGPILLEGKTAVLKVNGTNDIAIGDFLCTYTEAKIACKASGGDMAFAIALATYTNNDSNGVIAALLFVPRKI